MRYAIISDIHGNLEALEAVLTDIYNRNIDIVICLGDIVGYYPDPELCVQIIQKNITYSVAGNHDYAAIGRIKTDNFTYYAHEAMEWTKKNLTERSKKFLSFLPLTIQMDKMLFTHSSPAKPEEFNYIFPNSKRAILEAFHAMVHKITFIGHAHWPFIMVQSQPGKISYYNDEAEVVQENYYLVNVGSVGQPRNLDPRSSYALYDTDISIVSLIQVPYDFTVTQKKVMKHKLPAFLAQRLTDGR